MSVLKSRIFCLVALAGFIGVSSSEAAVQAQFHLPVSAHWGNAVLLPGDYKIRVTDEASGRNHFIIEGAGNTLYETPLAADPQALSSHSSLELVEVDGGYFVKEYRSGLAGRTFTFGVPKQVASHRGRTLEIAN